MTALRRAQCFRWFDTPESEAKRDQEDEKYDQGFHLTIIFNDPIDNKTLIAMTKDENRSGNYVGWANHKLRQLLLFNPVEQLELKRRRLKSFHFSY